MGAIILVFIVALLVIILLTPAIRARARTRREQVEPRAA